MYILISFHRNFAIHCGRHKNNSITCTTHTHLYVCICVYAPLVMVWLALIYWFRILLLYGINIEWLSEWAKVRHWLIVLRAFKIIWYTAGLHVARINKKQVERNAVWPVLPINNKKATSINSNQMLTFIATQRWRCRWSFTYRLPCNFALRSR